MATKASISAQADANMLKEMIKLIHRIERILVPINSLVHTNIGEKLDGLLVEIKKGKYFEDVNKFPVQDLIGYDVRSIEPLFRKVAWEKLGMAIWTTLNDGNEEYFLPDAVINEIAMERQVHEDKLQKAVNKERVRRMQQRNGLPIMAGKWRKEPYAKRQYDYLMDYCVTQNVSEEEGRELKEQLDTPLDGFLGQAYNYDDHDLTEEWMVTFKDKGAAGPSDDDVIRTQLESLMEIMLFAVQDRVCTETGVLKRPFLQLGKDVKEVPVWGIDCYTRRMVEMSIEDRVPAERRSEDRIREFVERRLLPAINDQAPLKAHDMTNSVSAIIQNPKSSALDVEYAQAVLAAIKEYTIDVFRIHPKGSGVVCINPAGIQPHVFVTEYLGELYPSYRWCERLDVVEQAQKTFELKPTLPDFYNILLERPRQDPNGYGLLYVDASRKANMGSSCSHSCDSNCTSAVVARNGKLVICLTTNRYVHYGEELTMDYYSITTSDMEWRAAICLCGSTSCRGSFLHYATQDDLQQVLNQSCGPLWRYASLLRACSGRPMPAVDAAVLTRHGMQSAALGKNPPTWVQKFAVDNLRFVEFERKALPCALLRSKNGSKSLYTFSAADMDARSVMEQRLQSMVCCFSMVQQVIARNELQQNAASSMPLVPYLPGAAVSHVWERLGSIPQLLREHLLDPAKFALKTVHLSALQNIAKLKPSKPPAISPSSASSSKENASLSTGVDPITTPAQLEKTTAEKRALVELIESVIAAVEAILADKPAGLMKLREACLAMRTALLKIDHLSSPKARIGQLADVLVFWAYTSNFSTVQKFRAVESGPIEVYARELGTSIPRMKVYKHFRGGDLPLRSRDKLSETSSEAPAPTSAASGASSGAGRVSSIASIAVPAVSEAASEVTSTERSATVTSDDSQAASADEVPVQSAPTESTETAKPSGESVDTQTTAETESPMEVDVPTGTSETTDSTPDASEEATAELTTEAMQSAAESATGQHSKEFFLHPDETVFTGTMKFPELFIFWQLMGWFNAGTDQKIDAPDLFGCVELPAPSNCFGAAEVAYGSKQREMLIELLRDDKKQTMSWPALLKQSFTWPTTPDFETPLYGSPMLDGALGQVGMVSKVIATMLESHVPAPAPDGKKKKGSASTAKADAKAKAADNTQFDNILPPEMPTSWVQCELCRKWRRVAWHVDSEALPDLWECPMNTWDPENATCDAPQDGYDPDAENTLGFGTSEVAVDASNFTIGKKFDVFCLKNKVYYEASVLKIKKNPKRPDEPPKAVFRFLGWGARFDEPISIDSDRIAPHNLHTNPAAHNPRDQEKWQGAKNLYEDNKRFVIVSAFKNTKKSSAEKAAADSTGDGAGKRKRAAPAKKAPAKASKAGTAAKIVSPAYCDDFEDLMEDGSADGAAGAAANANDVSFGTEADEKEGFPIAGLFGDEFSPEKIAKLSE